MATGPKTRRRMANVGLPFDFVDMARLVADHRNVTISQMIETYCRKQLTADYRAAVRERAAALDES